MSRIGKQPISVPSGVEVKIDGNTVTVKGSKGELSQSFNELLHIEQEDNAVIVKRPDDSHESRALHGLTRSLIHNMIIGVSEGYEKRLELVGVGYRAALKGKDLDLSLGFSHPTVYKAPEGITFETPSATQVVVKGIDKQKVGQVAAEIRGIRPPEPYKGKGVRYEGEYVRRKLGKAAK
ncbi:MAG: 50S ribosomal protein L6 [Coriobacteriia bacterium]|nr:50S ribosomal protein L6 [Coriobacteriia bacterium]